MRSTSVSLSKPREVIFKNGVTSSHYGSASEVVRDALRPLEEQKTKMGVLHSHLAQNAQQAQAGEFVLQPLGTVDLCL